MQAERLRDPVADREGMDREDGGEWTPGQRLMFEALERRLGGNTGQQLMLTSNPSHIQALAAVRPEVTRVMAVLEVAEAYQAGRAFISGDHPNLAEAMQEAEAHDRLRQATVTVGQAPKPPGRVQGYRDVPGLQAVEVLTPGGVKVGYKQVVRQVLTLERPSLSQATRLLQERGGITGNRKERRKAARKAKLR